MRPRTRRFAVVPSRIAALISVALVVLASCIARRVRVEPVPDPGVPIATHAESPAKAHLIDGSTVLFAEGFTVSEGRIGGRGVRYDLTLRDSAIVASIPLDSIVAMEAFGSEVKTGETILRTVPAAIGGIAAVGAVAIVIACSAPDAKCFGSCPTVYSDSAGVPILEAEAFPYAIAPALEHADVDLLRAQPDPDGTLRLEFRNEALETHYLNQLELLEVAHASDEHVVPDAMGAPLAVAGLDPPIAAFDRGGRDLVAAVSKHDGAASSADSVTLAAAVRGDQRDHLYLQFAVPIEADSVALLLRYRNSLLATVLLYDLMLADHGARAVDWLISDLGSLETALRLNLWVLENLGMRVSVWDGSAYRPVGRVPDTGPVAWRDVALVIPALTTPTLDVRLDFVADAHRIDRIAVAARWRRPSSRPIPLGRVETSDGSPHAEALASLTAPDDRRLKTSSGERFFGVFETGLDEADRARTFFLRSSGYYLEWIRRGWLESARDTAAFRPDRAVIAEALRRWLGSRAATEAQFYATKVPVR